MIHMIEVNDVVHFLADSRNGDWKKGDRGTISRILAVPPGNQNQLFIVEIEKGTVWATDKDVISSRQMTIFDVLPIDDAT